MLFMVTWNSAKSWLGVTITGYAPFHVFVFYVVYGHMALRMHAILHAPVHVMLPFHESGP